MLRKNKSHVYLDLPASKLYFEDIAEICQILNNSNPDYSIKIETDEFEFENADELMGHFKNKKLNKMFIKLFNEKEDAILSVNLSKRFPTCYISKDDNFILGIFHRISKLLKERRLYYFFKNEIFIGAFTAFVFLSSIMILSKTISHSSLGIALPIMMGAVITAAILSCYMALFFSLPDTCIILEKKSERENFFIRNKDKLILVIFSSIISAILSVTITLLVKK